MLNTAITVFQQYPAFFYVSLLCLGLIVGSFINVVVFRLPEYLQWKWGNEARELLEIDSASSERPRGIVTEHSACPSCGHKIRWWENIPVLSFVLLKGKCSQCLSRISIQYPAVELFTGIVFLICAIRFGVTADTFLACGLSGCLITLAIIDFKTMLLLDAITLPLLWGGLLYSLVEGGVSPTESIAGAALGYLFLWAIYWLFLWIRGKEGLGYGDFKLVAAMGAWCGIFGLFPILLLGSVSMILVAPMILAIRKQKTSHPIPFGPTLALAGWAQFVLGIYWEPYLRSFGFMG